MNKTRKNTKSDFGIKDCNKPRVNNKANYSLNKKNLMKLHKKTLKGKKHREPFTNIILFPHMLGQTRGGVEKAPRYLERFIGKKHKIIKPKLTSNLYKNLNILYNANKETNGRKINIGGDHSMSIATIADTLNRYPNAKVIYFDAHGDINTYASSKSKHFHGMPLSFLSGIDSNKRFAFIKNTIPLENILYIGSRCLDPFEVETLYKNNIKYIPSELLNNNIDKVKAFIDDFVKDDAIHISYDVDSIDPKYIPSTGTPVKGGIELNKAISLLKYLYNKNVVNFDITELNSELGSKADASKSQKNTVKLFKEYLS